MTFDSLWKGPEEVMGKRIVDITDESAYILDDVLHMQLSRDVGGVEGKTAALAASRLIRARMVKGMAKLGVRTKASVRNLGIDFGAGRTTTRSKRHVLSQRMGKVGRWVRRAARCKGKGRREVMRIAITATISYGAAVAALPRN